jgi:hypothetical protein
MLSSVMNLLTSARLEGIWRESAVEVPIPPAVTRVPPSADGRGRIATRGLPVAAAGL